VTSGVPSYLNAVDSSGRPDFIGVPDSVLLVVGDAVCGDLTGGATVGATLLDGIQAAAEYPAYGLDSGDMGFMLGVATTTICPQFEPLVTQYLAANGLE
jgi:hypothetical protein